MKYDELYNVVSLALLLQNRYAKESNLAKNGYPPIKIGLNEFIGVNLWMTIGSTFYFRDLF